MATSPTGFTVPDGNLITRSVVRKLHAVADTVRDLKVKLGLRTYSVRVVRQRWTGKFRGQGAPETWTMDILPVPRVEGIESLFEVVGAAGKREEGVVVVDQISLRYTEAQLQGWDDAAPVLDSGLATVAPDARDEVFWEIELVAPDGQPSQKRRFSLARAPEYMAGKLYWRVTLERAQGDRERNGDAPWP